MNWNWTSKMNWKVMEGRRAASTRRCRGDRRAVGAIMIVAGLGLIGHDRYRTVSHRSCQACSFVSLRGMYHKPTLSLMPLYGGCCWFGVRFCERRCDFAALCSLRVQCSATTACKRSRLISSTKTFSSKRLLTPSTTQKGREGQRTVTV